MKIFITVSDIRGYQVDPPNSFSLNINYVVYFNEPVPGSEGNNFDVNVPLGATPYAIYAEVFQRICAFCEQSHLGTPTKNDVFGYIPTPFSVLLPDLPSFA